MSDATAGRSYRALLAVPSLGRIVVGMTIARVGGSMISVAMVLFTLAEYHSAALAGIVTFMSIFPGILASPIAGALLDRHGRTRLVILDYVVAAFSLLLIAVLAGAHALPSWLLVAIVAVASLTGPLSNSGLRSLFPIIVPPHLWERANAVDSNGYVVATLLGPPVAGAAVEILGGPAAIAIVGMVFAAAAVSFIGVPDPKTETATSGRLLTDALDGLRYAWANRTIRVLGFSISILNLAGGMSTIVVPIIILDRLGGSAAMVGLAWAVTGLTGMVSAFAFGRIDTRGRERPLLVLPMAGYGLALILLVAPGGYLSILASMAVVGLVSGPMDIAMFTIRQRRTEAAWMGRAFAVSMAFNFAGFPIGSAISGWLVGQSIEITVGFGVVAALLGALIAWQFLPHDDAIPEVDEPVESEAPAEREPGRPGCQPLPD